MPFHNETSTSTLDWTFSAFGGTWGIAEYRIDPGGGRLTELWLFTEIVELRVAMLTMLTILIALGVAFGMAIAFLRRRHGNRRA